MIWRRTKPSTAVVDNLKGFDDFELRLGDVMRGERATLGKSLLDVQRELKIKATYIAAIENCDISAFETPGFVAGYVRSYARYLGMDPDSSFHQFCAEAKFEVAHGMSAAASTAAITAVRSRVSADVRDPLADPNASFIPRPESIFAQIEPGAVGSVLVLFALIVALGYGGWSVLQEVQRVQLAPVDQAPSVVAQIDALATLDGPAPVVRSVPESTVASVADAAKSDALMDRLYRPEALDVPVMVSRDGPISAINPRETGALVAGGGVDVALAEAVNDPANASPAGDALESRVQVVAEAVPAVELLAVRPSWVRVSAPDGTVLFEKILDAGERYVVPQTEQAALLRSGNSGSVYFVVNGKTYGPAAPGAQVVKNVTLSPDALTGTYALADLSGDADLARVVAVAEAVTSGDAVPTGDEAPAIVAPTP
jgi:hypothetical protein